MEDGALACTYWKQRMKDIWLQHADTSAKICYTKVKIRSSRKHIDALQDEVGNWVPNSEEMLALVVNVFKQGYLFPSNQADDRTIIILIF